MAGKSSKRWQWLVGAAAVVAVIVLSTGQDRQGTGTDGSRPCTMKVTEALNVRSGPDSNDPVVETLAAGEVVSVDLTTRNGYRQLGPDRWAAQLYLEPAPGSNCGSPVG
ncbi:MAG: SH3 domain-containing protein [Pseudonocardiaceae bacterium]